jgi:hypothetical protein
MRTQDDLGGAFVPAAGESEPNRDEQAADGHELFVQVDEARAHGTYCNMALFSLSETEIGIDFLFAHHQQDTAKLCARILLHPKTAKRIAMTLHQHVSEYERLHGRVGD